jgi:hypothetical protein
MNGESFLTTVVRDGVVYHEWCGDKPEWVKEIEQLERMYNDESENR